MQIVCTRWIHWFQTTTPEVRGYEPTGEPTRGKKQDGFSQAKVAQYRPLQVHCPNRGGQFNPRLDKLFPRCRQMREIIHGMWKTKTPAGSPQNAERPSTDARRENDGPTLLVYWESYGSKGEHELLVQMHAHCADTDRYPSTPPNRIGMSKRGRGNHALFVQSGQEVGERKRISRNSSGRHRQARPELAPSMFKMNVITRADKLNNVGNVAALADLAQSMNPPRKEKWLEGGHIQKSIFEML
ncbi:hypothetical protein EDB85DRAFT_1889420 [Lactarius pseudohatsudake]|nr:hypothetical protein EDB85DRAFT_1889420 [Lactarius pseudohatsudake]